MAKKSPRTDKLEMDVASLKATIDDLEGGVYYLHDRIDELLSRLAFAAEKND